MIHLFKKVLLHGEEGGSLMSCVSRRDGSRFFSRWCLVLALLGLICVEARAQKPDAPPKPPSNYLLSPGDVVEIKVFREPDLTSRQRISLEGTIKYHLIGIVGIAGLSTDQAAGKIAALLDKDYVIEPQVSVVVSEYVTKQFTALGQVSKPGTYDIPAEQTLDLLTAIAMAGGLTPKANPTRIRVTRGTGDAKQTFRVTINQMMRDSKTERFIIQPNDVINVEDAFLRGK